jgi:alkylation response protein AidB-like acyl-CoA dehydrogenase
MSTQCGSDAAAIETTADFKGDHWIINGTKIFITNGAAADFVGPGRIRIKGPGIHLIVERECPLSNLKFLVCL